MKVYVVLQKYFDYEGTSSDIIGIYDTIEKAQDHVETAILYYLEHKDEKWSYKDVNGNPYLYNGQWENLDDGSETFFEIEEHEVK